LPAGNNEKAGRLGSGVRGAGCAERVACYVNRRIEQGAEEIKLEGWEAWRLGGWEAGRLGGLEAGKREGDGDAWLIVHSNGQGS